MGEDAARQGKSSRTNAPSVKESQTKVEEPLEPGEIWCSREVANS